MLNYNFFLVSNPELKFVATQLAALRIEIATNNKLIKSVILDSTKFKIKLPLEDLEEVNELNKKINEDDQVFVNSLVNM